MSEKLHSIEGGDDFKWALEENPQPNMSLSGFDGILAEIPGENDELNWHWILKLKNGHYVYAVGWCDYTGWDCQSGLETTVVSTWREAVNLSPEREDSSHRYIREQLEAQCLGKQPYALYIDTRFAKENSK